MSSSHTETWQTHPIQPAGESCALWIMQNGLSQRPLVAFLKKSELKAGHGRKQFSAQCLTRSKDSKLTTMSPASWGDQKGAREMIGARLGQRVNKGAPWCPKWGLPQPCNGPKHVFLGSNPKKGPHAEHQPPCVPCSLTSYCILMCI